MLNHKNVWMNAGAKIFSVAAVVMVAAGCVAYSEDSASVAESTPQAVAQEDWERLQDQYLAELDESAPDYFVADSAALTYLKQYCEIDQYGDAGETDVIDRTVAKYCNTALAEHLGVEKPKVALAQVDEAEFTRIAGEEFGVFEETYDDGSSNTPVSLARYLCEKADVTELERNLGDQFETSFQWFAMETFCPQKLG